MTDIEHIVSMCDQFENGIRDLIIIINMLECNSIPMRQLEELACDLIRICPINLPFVILAMNKKESDELRNDSIFADKNIKNNFLKFIDILKSGNSEYILNDYKDYRDDWIPSEYAQYSLYHIEKQKKDEYHKKSIKEIILNILRSYTDKKCSNISPDFLSEQFCSDTEEREKSISRLKKERGIIIVDAVSLFHPKLYKYFYDSSLVGDCNVSTIILFPATENSRYCPSFDLMRV